MVREGPEQSIFSCHVDAFIDGVQLTVSDPEQAPACLMLVVTNKCLYLVDITFPTHPSVPRILDQRHLGDMTRLVKGYLPQYLVVGWAAAGMRSAASEQFMVIVCHREIDRGGLLSTVYELSEPAGGAPKHRVLVQTDGQFKKNMEDQFNDDRKMSTFGYSANSGASKNMSLFILSESQLIEIQVMWSSWHPPDGDSDESESDGEADVELSQWRAERKEGNNAGDGAGPMLQAMMNGQKDADTGHAAEHVVKERQTIRAQEDSLRAQDQLQRYVLLSKVGQPNLLKDLAKVAFLPDKMPKMLLGFGSGSRQVNIEFFDDMTRESWRRALIAVLSRGGSDHWMRSYDAAAS